MPGMRDGTECVSKELELCILFMVLVIMTDFQNGKPFRDFCLKHHSLTIKETGSVGGDMP